MAGIICPKCGRFTLFATDQGRKCTKCGYAVMAANTRKKTRCPICGNLSFRNGVCEHCGAHEQMQVEKDIV